VAVQDKPQANPVWFTHSIGQQSHSLILLNVTFKIQYEHR